MDMSFSHAINHSSAAALIADTYASAHVHFQHAAHTGNPDMDFSAESISRFAEHVAHMLTPNAMIEGIKPLQLPYERTIEEVAAAAAINLGRIAQSFLERE
jgi:hypothetical protein